jgi:hypothetical protein
VTVTVPEVVNDPPATAVDPALVDRDFTVIEVLMVAANPFAKTSSSAAGKVPPLKLAATQLPLATNHRSAIVRIAPGLCHHLAGVFADFHSLIK